MKKFDEKIHLDIPMTKENAWLFRMNGELEEEEADLEKEGLLEDRNDGERNRSADSV